MKHCGTQKLETERLILRRFVPEDADAMYRNWASDDDVTKYLTWPTHGSVEVSRTVLADWVPLYENENYYQWAIVRKGNGNEPIGSISAVGMNDDISMIHIGYCIGRSWWHQGITSEALRAVIDFFFETVGASRIESRHDPRNPRSGMVMRRCGMTYEGTMRCADRNNQGVCDASHYAILRSDRRKPDEEPNRAEAAMIELKGITEGNFIDAFNLRLAPGQERFVSHPIRSLAQAYVYREQCQPFGIHTDGKMIGYVMVIYDYDIPEYDIWHMMIDKSVQGRGYGGAALDRVIEYIRTKPFGSSNRVALTCNKENLTAIKLYESKGFAATGTEYEEEIELVLML